jgi:hypothetical protein
MGAEELSLPISPPFLTFSLEVEAEAAATHHSDKHDLLAPHGNSTNRLFPLQTGWKGLWCEVSIGFTLNSNVDGNESVGGARISLTL